jgi:mono/diheme cytochrome c family protein
MPRYRVNTTFALAMMLSLAGRQAMAAGDAENGEKIAQRWCAACHVVSPGQQRANADAPPFAEIGLRPGFSAENIAMFLLDPHPKMPNMSLTRREAEDLGAYIAKVGHRR